MESSSPKANTLPDAALGTTGSPSETTVPQTLPLAAPFYLRVLAYCIDWGLLGSLYVIIIVGIILISRILPSLMGGLGNSESVASLGDLLPLPVLILFLIVVLLGYFSFVHTYFIYSHLRRGATPGKQVLGLRVISLDGAPLNRNQCIMREFLVYLDLGFVLPGLISILVTRRNQRLGDLAAGTMVIRRPQEAQSPLQPD
ncbi:MAG: RDD family protein [Acidobacteriota bacterium]